MLLRTDVSRQTLLSYVKDFDGQPVEVAIPLHLSQQWLEYQLMMVGKGYTPLHITEYQKFLKQHSTL